LWLIPYPDASGVAGLGMSFDRHNTPADSECGRQAEDDLNKVSVQDRAHNFRGYVEILVARVNQVDHN
jgi:hypothetical protein